MTETDSLHDPPPADDDNVLPTGIRRVDQQGTEIVDALSGRASVFGFGFEPITAAIQAAAQRYLGDGSAHDQQALDDIKLTEPLLAVLGDSRSVRGESILLSPSAGEAVDRAVGLVRRHRSDTAFRTIAFVGADHGRTGMCRTASGRPELSAGFGPMMAGFTHVPLGDLDAVADAIDDQTAAVLLSPIDFSDAARPVDADFLTGLRGLCDRHQLFLVIDETQVVFGGCGKPYFFSAIADISADLVVSSAGLFGGLPGGLIVASASATGGRIVDIAAYPLLSAVAAATLGAMHEQLLPESATQSMHELAIAIAESLSGFEFIRDLHVLGMNLGVQADVESSVLVNSARTVGLRVESAGETAIRIQLPLTISAEDRQRLLEKLKATMEAVERETANLGV